MSLSSSRDKNSPPSRQLAAFDDNSFVSLSHDRYFPPPTTTTIRSSTDYSVLSLAGELERASSESLRNFGDKRLILERYIEGAKHIEVQLFGDSHGTMITLFERECSVQRRHQKVIEESPSANLSPDVRQRMSAAACEIGQALGYEVRALLYYITLLLNLLYYLT